MLYRLLWKLLVKGLRYRYLRLSGSSAAPEALSIEVTHRCIARCVMCNIWKIPASVPDLPVGDWMGLLNQPAFHRLKELDVTGGEPFLRNDLPSLMEGICALKTGSLRCLRSVALTTNGFLTETVVRSTRHMVDGMKKVGLDLVVVLAMDAVGQTHDRIRNVREGWQKLAATIDKLIGLRQDYPNLIIGLKTTILPETVDELDRIAQFAGERGLFTIMSPCIITEGRYGNQDLADRLRFGPEDIEKMIRFYEGPAFQWSYHRRGLLDLFEKGTLQKPCSAGFNYFFVRSTGDVHPCPLLRTSLGNIRDASMDELMRSWPARRFRREVGSFKECRSCTEPGLERYALPFEGFHYLKLFRALGRKDFLAFHRHMGLDKYI
ncbi:MAG: radical SAM protein [Syntrophorhabdales bacterium]|jgi:MoaA/NifB/PqqE/SkfB family radical SAM enzyme